MKLLGYVDVLHYQKMEGKGGVIPASMLKDITSHKPCCIVFTQPTSRPPHVFRLQVYGIVHTKTYESASFDVFTHQKVPPTPQIVILLTW